MYDAITERLITDVPELAGLDRVRLPRFLTSVYARLATARVALGAAAGRGLSPELVADLDRLTRLAGAFETLACLKERGDPTRASCAFVAATAHELVHQGRVLQAGPAVPADPPWGTFLRGSDISSDISALLLFQIAGAYPDAMSVARRLRFDEAARTVEALLIRSLRLLGEGKLGELTRLPAAPDLFSDLDGLEGVLLGAFWRALYDGVKQLASSLLGQAGVDAMQRFTEVRSLAATDISGADFVRSIRTDGPLVVQVSGGPHHLASLLIATAESLGLSAVAHVRPPSGCDVGEWEDFAAGLAAERPFLWQNHLDAISQGVLEQGTSAAISFPTGAGKSTLVQLKIAAALLTGRKVVFLVPTHALVDQTVRDLGQVFPDRRVARALALDIGSLPPRESLADIAVATPESCLAALGEERELFGSVGLVVFDECHLLHPEQGLEDRRSLDSMLCLLQLLDAAPRSDVVLLSAMMGNPGDLAAWLGDLHDRRCLALNLEWKPTRQARGCLVYEAGRVRELAELVTKEQQRAGTKTPPAALKKQLTAVPHALFCLRHAWTTESEDYAFVPLFDGQVTLAAARNEFTTMWQLTANRNDVSAGVAASLALAGIRTMILVQDVRYVASVAKDVARRLDGRMSAVRLGTTERALIDEATEEMGDAVHVLQPVAGLVGQHHGLLLPAERRLSELLFQREDGLPALVASPTLAMGVNLPAEAVVIAGDDRFDAVTQRMKQLEAHELLNAAGRAGRAGSCSQGVVIVVPGKVVGVDWGSGKVGPRWMDLQGAFSQSDQCLPISDPIKIWLDRLQGAALDPGDLSRTRYFLARLPARSDDDGEARRVLMRSLAAYHAKKEGRLLAYEQLVDHTCRKRVELVGAARVAWHRTLGSSAGVDPGIVAALDDALRSTTSVDVGGVLDWLAWWMRWLTTSLDVARTLHRAQERSDGLGRLFENGEALSQLHLLTRAWMEGVPLRDLELRLGTPAGKLGTCEQARKFVLRLIPDVSFGARLLARVYRAGLGSEGQTVPVALECLSPCIARGLSSPEELAVHYAEGGHAHRVRTKRSYGEIRGAIPAARDREDFRGVLARVRAARRRRPREARERPSKE